MPWTISKNDNVRETTSPPPCPSSSYLGSMHDLYLISYWFLACPAVPVRWMEFIPEPASHVVWVSPSDTAEAQVSMSASPNRPSAPASAGVASRVSLPTPPLRVSFPSPAIRVLRRVTRSVTLNWSNLGAGGAGATPCPVVAPFWSTGGEQWNQRDIRAGQSGGWCALESRWGRGEGCALPLSPGPPALISQTTDGQNPQGSHAEGRIWDVSACLQRCWATTSRETSTFSVSSQ